MRLLKMRLLIQSAMIFFGTLMAAALVALGEPQAASPAGAQGGADRDVLLVLQDAWTEPAAAPSGR